MEIKYKQPKLTDSLYGQMFWEDWDDETEPHWFARIDFIPNEAFEVLIETDSPLDFMAVRHTHPTFKKLMSEFSSIRNQMIQNILDNLNDWAENRTERRALAELLKKPLKIFSVTIYDDLSSEIEFAEDGYREIAISEANDNFYALIDKEGNFVEAGVCDY